MEWWKKLCERMQGRQSSAAPQPAPPVVEWQTPAAPLWTGPLEERAILSLFRSN